MSNKDEKKTTSEKPLSLFPLDFKEVLAAVFKIKPVSKEEMDKAIKDREKQQKKKKKPK